MVCLLPAAKTKNTNLRLVFFLLAETVGFEPTSP